MKKIVMQAFVLCALLFVIGGCGREDGNASGNETSVSDDRIIAATYAIVEITDALGIDLVGVPTTTKELPERYKGLPEIGNPMSPDMEVIKSLNPTDVLSVTTLEYDLTESFESMNVNATFANLQSYEEMKQTILDLGEKYDREKEADALVSKYDQKIKEIQDNTSKGDSPRVLILLGVPGSYLVATEHSYVGNLVELLGGTNAIEGQHEEYLSSNTEYLHESNPDIILRMSHGMPEDVIKMFDEEFKTDDIWKHFDAVKKGRVYDLEESLFGTTSSLQVDKALEELADILYPEK